MRAYVAEKSNIILLNGFDVAWEAVRALRNRKAWYLALSKSSTKDRPSVVHQESSIETRLSRIIYCASFENHPSRVIIESHPPGIINQESSTVFENHPLKVVHRKSSIESYRPGIINRESSNESLLVFKIHPPRVRRPRKSSLLLFGSD